MKTKWTLVVIVLVAIILHAYKEFQTSGISGRLSSKEAAEMIWAIQGVDSIKAVPENGVFILEAKPGKYKIIVDAKQPYKNVLVESIEVTMGKTTDLGEVKMGQ
ncbi:MAG: carboxypeptidase regulatory-like domain-containing protein [Chitinophagaceae bacterium]